MFVKSLLVSASLLALGHAYDGDGTFYGAGGAGRGGACQMDNRGVGVTVAMNAAQYGSGEVCGRCVRVTGQGSGAGATPIIGPIYAIVDNECPECKFGDVDFGLGGDGRWRIQWDFVSCDEARGAGSNLPGNGGGNNNNNGNNNQNNQGGGGGGCFGWWCRRSLRGFLESEEGQTYLAPGFMVTADGIRSIAEVEAERGQN